MNVGIIELLTIFVLATLNIVGGFVVTDRMLEMFKAKPAERAPKPGAGDGPPTDSSDGAR